MINTILWTSIGIPVAYFTYDIINSYYYVIYNRHISNIVKYNIIICIISLSFLRGYTNNDLVTNIKNIFF